MSRSWQMRPCGPPRLQIVPLRVYHLPKLAPSKSAGGSMTCDDARACGRLPPAWFRTFKYRSGRPSRSADVQASTDLIAVKKLAGSKVARPSVTRMSGIAAKFGPKSLSCRIRPTIAMPKGFGGRWRNRVGSPIPANFNSVQLRCLAGIASPMRDSPAIASTSAVWKVENMRNAPSDAESMPSGPRRHST